MMAQHDYRRPPEEIDMAAEERAIRLSTAIALVVTIGALAGGYIFLPNVIELPRELPDRLGWAATWWAVPVLALLVAIMMVSTTRRFSAADIGGQAAGPASEGLAVKLAFLQNTLEQTVLAAGFYFALAATADGAWMALLPVAAVLFTMGRILFYVGYKRGAKGRSLGMALTMLPAVLGYLVLAFLIIRG
jgi:hypothetical protein